MKDNMKAVNYRLVALSERTFRDAARAFFSVATRNSQTHKEVLMLVLSRKVNEQIVVNGGVLVITVVDIRDDKVRIGIDAPLEMSVHRREVQEAIDRERESERERQAGADDAEGSGTC